MSSDQAKNNSHSTLDPSDPTIKKPCETSLEFDTLTSEQVTEFRSQMPVTQGYHYLDHAAVGPLTSKSQQAIAQWLKQASQSGDYHWLSWSEQASETRKVAAELIGAEEKEIALVGSTTEGITMVSEGFPFQPGDNVVIPEGEFPANVYPWLHLETKGVQLRQVPMPNGTIDVQRLADSCDHRTRVVSVSWIGYSNGFRCDPDQIAQMAHDKGAYFFLDAIQGIGVFPLDVKTSDIDFLSADGHKWMLGPEGAGIAYIKHELLDLLRPTVAGWTSVKDCYQFDDIDLTLLESAARYEGGTKNHAGIIGLGGSLKTLKSFGLSKDSSSIAGQVLKTTRALVKEIQNLGFQVHYPEQSENQTGILSFEVPMTDPMEVRAELLQRKVISSCRGGKIRLAVHGYNNEQDFHPVLDFLAEIKK